MLEYSFCIFVESIVFVQKVRFKLVVFRNMSRNLVGIVKLICDSLYGDKHSYTGWNRKKTLVFRELDVGAGDVAAAIEQVCRTLIYIDSHCFVMPCPSVIVTSFFCRVNPCLKKCGQHGCKSVTYCKLKILNPKP